MIKFERGIPPPPPPPAPSGPVVVADDVQNLCAHCKITAVDFPFIHCPACIKIAKVGKCKSCKQNIDYFPDHEDYDQLKKRFTIVCCNYCLERAACVQCGNADCEGLPCDACGIKGVTCFTCAGLEERPSGKWFCGGCCASAGASRRQKRRVEEAEREPPSSAALCAAEDGGVGEGGVQPPPSTGALRAPVEGRKGHTPSPPPSAGALRAPAQGESTATEESDKHQPKKRNVWDRVGILTELKCK